MVRVLGLEEAVEVLIGSESPNVELARLVMGEWGEWTEVIQGEERRTVRTSAITIAWVKGKGYE